jgi:hypothetical protein
MITRQIGWSNESNLLYQILKQITRLSSIIFSLRQEATPKYKVYTALVKQSGTTAPEVTELENTIGNLVWFYREPGYYSLGNTDNLFTQDKVFINNTILAEQDQNVIFNRIINQDGSGFDVQKGYTIESSFPVGIRLKTYSDAETLSDDVLSNTPLCIEIRIYN